MQQVDVATAHAHQQHADGEAGEVEGGEVGVFFEVGEAAHQPGQQGHNHAGGKTARAHGGQAEAAEHVAHRRAGQYGVAERVAHQAHAPHHEEHAHRRGTEGEEHHRGQRVAHEVEFGKGLDQPFVKGDGHIRFFVFQTASGRKKRFQTASVQR